MLSPLLELALPLCDSVLVLNSLPCPGWQWDQNQHQLCQGS